MSKQIVHRTSSYIKQQVHTYKNGITAQITTYTFIRPRKVVKMINKYWEKLGKPLLIKSPNSVNFPTEGVKIIRTGEESLVVVQLSVDGISLLDNTTEAYIKQGFTHFYNEHVDDWISLIECKNEELLKQNLFDKGVQ